MVNVQETALYFCLVFFAALPEGEDSRNQTDRHCIIFTF